MYEDAPDVNKKIVKQTVFPKSIKKARREEFPT
jgi:hypothetical protein